MRRSDRIVLALVALLALAALVTRPLALALSPRFAVWSAFPLGDELWRLEHFPSRYSDAATIEAALDPWGRKFRFNKWGIPKVYSVGPDGRDDEGQGDDVAVEQSAGDEFLTWSAAWFGGAALVLLWLRGVIRLVQAPRSVVGIEVLRAAGIATVPVALGAGFVAIAPSPVLDAFAPLRAIPGVPPVASVLLTVALVSFLASFALRNRRGIPESETRPFPWRRAAVIALGVVVAGSLAVSVGMARYMAWRRARLLVAAQLGIASAVDEILESRDRDLVLDFVRNGPPDFPYHRLGMKALEAVASVGSETLPIFIRALRQDRDAVPASSWASIPMARVDEWDRHFDALAADVAEHSVEDRAITWTHTNLVASRLGSARALALLAPFLDDERREWEGPTSSSKRTCELALERMQGLVGSAHDFGIPDPLDPVGPIRLNAAIERARVWCQVDTPVFESEGWVVVHVDHLVHDKNGQADIDVKVPGHSWGARQEETRACGVLGPVRPGPATFAVTDSVAGTTIPVNVTVPARGTVWVDVDFAKGSATVEVEPRGP